MKFLLAILPLTVAASEVCRPGTYRCESEPTFGWSVCTVEGNWVRGGDCGKGEFCSFNPINQSPYCLPKPKEECSPGLSRCVKDHKGWAIEVCEEGKFEEKKRCRRGQVCEYGDYGHPQCKDKDRKDKDRKDKDRKDKDRKDKDHKDKDHKDKDHKDKDHKDKDHKDKDRKDEDRKDEYRKDEDRKDKDRY